jgi:hypothetical protein
LQVTADSSAASHDAWLTLAAAQEPEDRLLADALDLIGEARSALSPEHAMDQLSARDAALTALLESLV